MGSKLSKRIVFAAAFVLLCGLGSLCRMPVTFAVEEGMQEYRPSAFMVIEAKSRHSIVSSKRPFEVKRETRILDERGKEIKIQNLPVPCIAQVDYETSTYGDPVALKIRIREVFPGASID